MSKDYSQADVTVLLDQYETQVQKAALINRDVIDTRQKLNAAVTYRWPKKNAQPAPSAVALRQVMAYSGIREYLGTILTEQCLNALEEESK